MSEFKKSHSGILGDIQNLLDKEHSLIHYPFFIKIKTLCDSYGNDFIIGRTYKYQLMHYNKNEFKKGCFLCIDGDSLIFATNVGYDSFQLWEIVYWEDA